MPSARTGLVRLLALLLLMQWAGAVVPHARAMARAASAQAVELCTHKGRRLILLDGDGRPMQPSRADDCCTLCHGPLGTPAPGSAVMASPGGPQPAAEPSPWSYPDVLPPYVPPQQPRAPPGT